MSREPLVWMRYEGLYRPKSEAVGSYSRNMENNWEVLVEEGLHLSPLFL